MDQTNKFTKFAEQHAQHHTKNAPTIPAEVVAIITAATQYLLAKNVLKTSLNPEQLQIAENFFIVHTKNNMHLITKANIAILAVIKAGLLSTIDTTFLMTCDNILSLSQKPVDVTAYTEYQKIISIIQNSILNPLVLKQLYAQTENQNATTSFSASSSLAPTLNPIVNPYNPFQKGINNKSDKSEPENK
jgi:hypothetical protein